MADAILEAFQTEARAQIGKASFSGQQAAIAGQTWSQYFPVVPRNGSRVLGVLVQAAVALTATGAQNATANQTVGPTTTATDLLDEWVYEAQVCPAPNTQPRSYWTQRLALEETERITLDLRGQSYPRAVPTNFAGAGSRTDTSYLFIPMGDAGGAVRIHVPAITNVFAANVTATVTLSVYVVSGESTTIITAEEKNTPTTTGRYDVSQIYPADLAPTYVCFLNDTISTLTALYVTAQDRTILLDIQDTGIMTYAQTATVAPDTTYSYNDLVFAMAGKRFSVFLATFGGSAAVHDLLFLEFTGTQTSPTATSPASTPTTPASTMTGAPVAGGSAVAPVGGVGVAVAPQGMLGVAPTAAFAGGNAGVVVFQRRNTGSALGR